jgi:hypothetical protein
MVCYKDGFTFFFTMTYHIIVIFSFILIYTTRKIQKCQDWLKLNGANGFPVYVDENVNAIKKKQKPY